MMKPFLQEGEKVFCLATMKARTEFVRVRKYEASHRMQISGRFKTFLYDSITYMN